MYYPILIVVLAVAGIYFSFKTGFIQLRLFRESLRAVMEKPDQKGQVSSFQALMVSTASRVGTGNIVGVSTAIVLGGPGAAFWMWVLAIVGSATAFIESTLAQIYKRRDKETGGCYGGPAYYIESALKNKTLASLFVVFLILTYGLGFNLLCSYNLQSTFSVYSFYNPKTTPMIIGAIIAIAVFISIVGGGKRMIRVTEVIVPFMGVAYIIVSLIVVIMNIGMFPEVIKLIFTDAFSGRSFAGGLAGSCLIYGIKRGLYSNEAGVGSAPNAAASAEVSHPVKQGLVQVLSVYIDTIVICSATAFMILVSGIPMKEELAGAPMVQESLRSVFGSFGPLFITIAMIMFAFTTLIGNLYYCETGLSYLNGNKKPGKTFMIGFYVVAAIIVFVGATMEMDAAWASADITMGLMALINIPCCVIMGGVAIKAAKDYEKQRKAGQEPVFHSKVVGLDSKDLDYWE
ncbi:alanine/glycine:cation symporter family protein [Peptostreptococcus anaerobius]|uniref:alanine/glycine:cation symporter family protein n=1 Tax=Peptostreptococcus anaerobius TaxID=1261 RepID=UPI00232D1DF1|nr:alanine/glycine:cation symporter family protein [Peptostreptococcus anaerobius]MDB8821211.1 alanine/glycine:cation symporter family protein [Peptostreptococcus anaerobius]MDB8825829.1 alanine/glycine:cation symporter family protein [Peptostreptococcus anaerobius]MDB8827617.1 alanine/glycine:cation symporter family protein [Peptostreptococcus anaerobius]MDB8829514.1 alanine/glycine:cation symporter family protein [Peptostreptococcus anaerobius]MDB8831376.1 alanine/glycine:cation symporter fa